VGFGVWWNLGVGELFGRVAFFPSHWNIFLVLSELGLGFLKKLRTRSQPMVKWRAGWFCKASDRFLLSVFVLGQKGKERGTLIVEVGSPDELKLETEGMRMDSSATGLNIDFGLIYVGCGRWRTY